MVYIEIWDEFQRAVEELYAAAPDRTRFVTRYRHADGVMILRVTDGPTTLSYRTDRLPDLRKLERLNRSLMEKMMNRKMPEPGTEAASSLAPPTAVAGTAGTPSVSSPAAAKKGSTPQPQQQQRKGGGPVRGKGKKK